MTAALAEKAPRCRQSVPQPGLSLVAATEIYAIHVRAAVESVRHCFNDSESMAAVWAGMLASRWCAEPPAVPEMQSLQAAWALVSMRMVGRSVGTLSPSASLRDAEEWFVGTTRPPRLLSDAVSEFTEREAVRALEKFPYDDRLRDFLPYVLDVHGPGSRASVMRDPATAKSRRAKKSAGVFYTPSDVADYIAHTAIEEAEWNGEPLGILDPACGSGVFLRSVLDLATLRRPQLNCLEFVERSLYGIDVNPLAIEMACFILLHECIHRNGAIHAGRMISPWSLWHRIRCNLCVADALAFRLAQTEGNRTSLLARVRAALSEAYVSPSSDGLQQQVDTTLFFQGIALGSVFPLLTPGADIIIGNPPYAKIGSREDAASLEQRFVSLPAGGTAQADYFPLFVEMMWQLTRRDRSSSGMVVPLSLACSRRFQMMAIRRAIVSSGGRWRFAFFDREPHGLFGEEVKTRNAILFRHHDANQGMSNASIETGPLRKWTSCQRQALFDAIGFTKLGNGAIAFGIPKLSGKEAVAAFSKIAQQTKSLAEICVSINARPPEDAALSRQENCVYIGGTAYNFLNVFRSHRSLPRPCAPWSASKVLVLTLSDEDDAALTFALLSSRLAFWLWHVTQDGFHVTRDFVMSLPIGAWLFEDVQKDALANLGTFLWEDLQHQQIVSINGGRQTIAYRPHGSDSLRNKIDALLVAALNLAPTFSEYLREYVRSVVTVDGHRQSNLAVDPPSQGWC